MKLELIAIGVAAGTVALAQLDLSVAKPPTAAKKRVTVKVAGDNLVDDYAWIKNKKDPKVIEYITAENAYREKVMAPTKALQEKLYKEMLGRIQEDDTDVPVFDRGYWYYSRTVKGKEYAVNCRRKGTMKAREEVMLDENDLAKGKPYFSLGAREVSPNGRYLAYTTDVTGFREYYLNIKDLLTGNDLPEKSIKVGAIVWCSDNKTIFYTTEDEAKRTDKLWRYELGSGKPVMVAEERDELFWLGASESSDHKYLFVGMGSKDTDETWFLPLDKPTAKLKLIKKRGGNSRYDVDHMNGQFWITTNDRGDNGRVVRAPDSNTDPAKWIEVIPHSDTAVISRVKPYRDFMVVAGRKGGFPNLAIFDYKSGKTKSIPTDDVVADIGLANTPDMDSKSINYSYTSLTTPNTISRYDIASGKSKVLKREPVKGYKESDYVSELMWATAADGTKVPISMVRKRTTKPSPQTPLMLYAYGSYGASSDPWFSSGRLNLLNRGMIFAIAHIRGGGEFGRAWYEAGKMGNKMNTFTDFIACGDHLVAEGYTSHNRMAMNGGSAGGLLMGAVMNLRPNLAKVAVADVPFVDVINTMLDESLPLTVGEFVEWGNPKDEEQYQWMRAYSPYDNVVPQDYPHTLITTSLNDSQVLYHEPVKWCAKLRATKTGSNALLLRCNMDAGHGGASGRYSNLRERTISDAFVLWQLGIKK